MTIVCPMKMASVSCLERVLIGVSNRLPQRYLTSVRRISTLCYPNNVSCLTGHKRFFSDRAPEDNFNLAKDAIEPLARTKGHKPALIFTDGSDYREEVTYKDLFDSSVSLATALSIRASPPKLALVVLPKIPPWWVINVAASWAGLIISPGTSMLTPQDVQYRLAVSGADAVFCDPTLVEGVDRAERSLGREGPLLKVVVGARPDQSIGHDWVRYEELLVQGASREQMPCHANRPNDICQLFFTSGTTGKPKMVPHTHCSYGRGHQITASTWLDLREDDVLWNVSDTGWAKAAWSSLYTPFLAGATAFVHQMGRFDPLQLLSALQREPVSVLCAPPTAYRALVQAPLQDYAFSHLRHCVSAGEPLNPEVTHTWKKMTGLDIYEGFGQSETTLVCGTMRGMTVKPGAMGRPAPGYDVKVVDEDLQEVGPGEEGQIGIRTEPHFPTGLFRGYHNDPERTASAFRGGYYLTGDRGHFDPDGYLWFVARNDDVIISSGYRIGPFEVESALLEHNSVVEAGVVGVPDPIRGHIVKAFVVLTEKAYTLVANDTARRESLVKELQAHVKTSTAPYKYPRKIQFVESLPKTVSGKIRRVELRQMKDPSDVEG